MIELVAGTVDTSAAARISTTVRRWIVIEPEAIEHSRATIPMFRDWLALLDGEPVGVGSCSLNLGMEEDTAAFATANQFTIGSASRNPVRGPSYRDVDLAVMRRVGFTGERAVELRLEVFNLLNTANFGAPAAQFGPASFGTITTALDPRVVQLAAKFWF